MAYKCDECGTTSEEKENCCGSETKEESTEKENDSGADDTGDELGKEDL